MIHERFSRLICLSFSKFLLGVVTATTTKEPQQQQVLFEYVNSDIDTLRCTLAKVLQGLQRRRGPRAPCPPFFANYALERQLIVFCRGSILASKLGPLFFGLVGGPVLGCQISPPPPIFTESNLNFLYMNKLIFKSMKNFTT